MNRSTVLDLKKIRIFKGIVYNRITILLMVSFFIGIIIGTASFEKSTVSSWVAKTIFSAFLNAHTDVSFFKGVVAFALPELLFLIILFLSGTSVLGIIISPMIIVVRGFLYGSLCSFLYSSYGVKGIAVNAVIIVPSAIIIMLALIFVAKYAISFSLIIAKLTLPRTAPANLCIDFKKYYIQCAVLIPLIFVAALLDALLSKSFLLAFNL